MPDPSPQGDTLTALLEPIRADLRAAGLAGLLDADPAGDYFPAALARHSSALLAAIDAVLELPGEWEREAGRLSGLNDGASRTFDECAEALREAITRELTRQEAVAQAHRTGKRREELAESEEVPDG
jgi:hypothetical protein